MAGIDYNLPGAYQSQQADAENAYQQALTNIAQKQASLAHDTGFTYNQNDDGSVSNVAIDPANQYSQVMGLLGSHAQSLTDLRNNLASRGLNTGTGLAGKRAALAKYIQQGETAGLGSTFLKGLSGLFDERGQALNTRNSAFTSAEQAALLYALQQQAFNTAAPAQDAGGSTGGAGGDAAPGDSGGGNYSPPAYTPPSQTFTPRPGDPANLNANYPHLNPSLPQQVFTPVFTGSARSFEPKPTGIKGPAAKPLGNFWQVQRNEY